MKKYDYISTLAQETAANIVKSSAEWMKYLTTAARLYKYSFCDQLLIYAQRPDATACASMDIWNEKMHCWVNRGASGIALIDESAKGKKLKYVFDVSDVHAANHIGRYPQSWVLEEKHKDDVISHLETIYGGTDEDKSFEERLFEVSQKIVADYYEEILPDLQNKSEGSSLENLDEQNIGIRFKENDGRKLALDQRLINDMLPDNDNSKAAACVERAYKIWKDTMEQRSTQLIFCDLSTPKGDGTFNVYEDVKEKLMDKGVPGNEIAFIHDANTELRKAELFAKVRSGQVRFLLGSTAKMGAGTNVQDRLIALHHLDVPWRPSDIEQQEGRILRQGNQNAKVKIFRYVTEGTFDSYSWQLIENKQKFIGQIMTSKSPVRSCEDVDEAALSYAEVKALATGNPYIKEKMDLDIQVARLKLMKANHTSQKYRLEDNITQHYPQQIAHLKESIEGFSKDIQRYKRNKPLEKEDFSITVCGKEYSDKKEAGIALIAICKESKDIDTSVDVGEYLGFSLKVKFDAFYRKFVLNVKGDMSHPIEIGVDPFGNLTRINNALEAMPAELEEAQTKLSNVEHQLETAKIEVNKPFLQEAELSEKLERLVELDTLLNMGEKEDSIIENTTEDIIEPVITPANKFTKRVKPRGPKL